MSVVKWIMRPPRLASLVRQSGGVTVGRALEAVPLHVEPLREQCLAAVDDHIAALEALVAEGEPEDRAAALKAVYGRAAGVLDAAGPFDLEDVCKAAWSLCELVDRYGRAGRADWRAVEVHVQALHLLRHMPAGAVAERRQLLAGLGEQLSAAATA